MVMWFWRAEWSTRDFVVLTPFRLGTTSTISASLRCPRWMRLSKDGWPKPTPSVNNDISRAIPDKTAHKPDSIRPSDACDQEEDSACLLCECCTVTQRSSGATSKRARAICLCAARLRRNFIGRAHWKKQSGQMAGCPGAGQTHFRQEGSS